MREIEFRVWSDNKKVIGTLAELSGSSIPLIPGDTVIIRPKNDYTVFEQFTGLRDKNGVKIFEGDQFQSPNGKNKGVIIWEEPFARFVGICENGTYWHLNTNEAAMLTIIGNIHETPKKVRL